MNNENEIQLAWTIWHLMARLNESIWNRYENEFIKQYIKLEEKKDSESQSDKDPLWHTE